MEREMKNVKVFITDDRVIEIIQEGSLGEEFKVLLMPEQVELLCAWLDEAKEIAEAGAHA